LSSIGDGPITCGKILAAAAAHELSVAEQAEADCRASGSDGVNCAKEGKATKQSSIEAGKKHWGNNLSRNNPHLTQKEGQSNQKAQNHKARAV
jgi:hypothetical protein